MRALRNELLVTLTTIIILGLALYFGMPPLVSWGERIRVRAAVTELRSLGVLPDSGAVRVRLEDARHE